MLRSDLCDSSHAYIVVIGAVTVSDGEKDKNERNRDFSFAFQK